MATSAYNGAQTATDILLGYNRYLRDEICREELDDRDLVRCLVEAGLVVGIGSIGGDTSE